MQSPSADDGIHVAGWRIVGRKGRRHVEFCLSESPAADPASQERFAITWRRWSSFKALQRRLGRRFPTATPALSTDAWRRHLDDPDFLAQRQVQLQRFLGQCLEKPALRGSQEMWSFLMCDIAGGEAGSSGEESPAEADDTIEGETSSGELLVARSAGLKRQRRVRRSVAPMEPPAPAVTQAAEAMVLILLVAAFIIAATSYPPAPSARDGSFGFFLRATVPLEGVPGDEARAVGGVSDLARAIFAGGVAFGRTLVLTLAGLAALRRSCGLAVGFFRPESSTREPTTLSRHTSVDDAKAEEVLAAAAGPLPVVAERRPRQDSDASGDEGQERGGAETLQRLKRDLVAMMDPGCETLPRIFTDAYLEQVLRKPGRTYDYTRSKLGKCLAFRKRLGLDPGPPAVSEETRQVLSTGCLYWHGFDPEGRPIIWAHPSRVDWSAHSAGAFVAAVAVLWDLGLQRMPAHATQFVYIECTHGGGWEAAPLSKVLRVVRHGLDLLLTGFPDRVHAFHIAPSTSLNRFIFRFSRPLLPPGVKDKMNMVEQDPELLRAHLAEVVGQDHVPDFYGGSHQHRFGADTFELEDTLDAQAARCQEKWPVADDEAEEGVGADADMTRVQDENVSPGAEAAMAAAVVVGPETSVAEPMQTGEPIA